MTSDLFRRDLVQFINRLPNCSDAKIDPDDDVIFASECAGRRVHFCVIVDDDDHFIQLTLINFYSLDDPIERAVALSVCERINNQMKAVKLYVCKGGQVSCSVESYVGSREKEFKTCIPRMLKICASAAERFRDSCLEEYRKI